MSKRVDVLIIGGGISGLTLANLLIHGNKKVKFHVTIFESRLNLDLNEESLGGGIGIWPPSQSVLNHLLTYQNFINEFGYLMPPSSYRNADGKILAEPHEDFEKKFPVQCLNRHDLINLLFENLCKNRSQIEIENKNDIRCKREKGKRNEAGRVSILPLKKIDNYQREKDKILVTVDNRVYKGDLLIACDGIHSKIRNCLMSELKLPPVYETHLGYTYFRSNTNLPTDTKKKWWSVAFETWGTCKSKQYGNYEIRFGYVPLKPPTVFWFLAVRTQPNHPYLSPIRGVKLIDEETKSFLIELIDSWKPIISKSNQVAVDYKQLIDLSKNILRTDISKIKGVETFPWTSKDNRIVLLGDSAHATAPNLAQGAGLCIEDAACLASKLNRVDYTQGIFEYEKERKPRAQRVQNIADFIALIGQVENPVIKVLRNTIMRSAYLITPGLQQSIFEYLVSFSLGGTKKSKYWRVPRLSIADDVPSSLLGRALPSLELLNNQLKNFKVSQVGGSGEGIISIEKPTFFAKILGALLNFPKAMKEKAFYGEVINLSEDIQRWKRTFDYNSSSQQTYTTSHSLYCGFKREVFLSESFGGFLDKIFQFIYKIKLQPDQSLKYESQGVTFLNAFKIPLPNFLLPQSKWVETPTKEGWKFDGTVSFPLLGTLLHYYGHFNVHKISPVSKNRRVIIAGGSGMIGKAVCLEFLRKGYDVYCLSRYLNTPLNINGVNIRLLNEDWSDLIDKKTIILNLSGANPGAKRWTPSVKLNIAESRFQTIQIIIDNIANASEKPLKYLQASAAGFYGDAKNSLVTEESEPSYNVHPGTAFRIDVCKKIEHLASQADCDVVNLRIGHVLSNSGGILPYFRLAGYFCVGKFGSGNQFVPFVHIHDVVKAIEFVSNSKKIKNGAVNITAPRPCKNSELLKSLSLIKGAPEVPLPQSILKLIIGQSFVVLTDSERIQPKRLLESGFEFKYHGIEDALNGLQ